MRPHYDPEIITQFANGCSVLVVIVNYRTPQLTVDCLKSLATEARTDATIRVVIVDNPSGDDSISIIGKAIQDEGFSEWAMLVASDHNGGYSFGNNLAIRPSLKAARPPSFVWLLNPDTEVQPGAIKALVDFMAPRPQVGIAGSCLMNPDGSAWATAFRFPTALGELETGMRLGLVTKLLRKWVVARVMGNQPEQVDWLPGASMMIRREVFDTIGLMDEQYFLYYEETDFCLQSSRAGFTCWYVPESRVMHIAGQSTGVTSRDTRPKRRPQYVFDSRRRYYVKNFGFAYAALADLAFISGFALWRLRRALQRKSDTDPPYLLFDSFKNSVMFKREKL